MEVMTSRHVAHIYIYLPNGTCITGEAAKSRHTDTQPERLAHTVGGAACNPEITCEEALKAAKNDGKGGGRPNRKLASGKNNKLEADFSVCNILSIQMTKTLAPIIL